MPPLSSDYRKLLEKTVIAARVAGVKGAGEALQSLAVDQAKPFDSMDETQRDLRRRLRARGRQLGDVRSPNSTQTIRRLTQEIAYEHWHRMLFARFLAENQLLIEPDSKVAISMDEVEEIAREEGIDPRELAASYAQRSLPQIFRTDDPVFEVTFAPETRVKLDQLLDALPAEVFTGDDALGWVYQFWQSAEKDEVNARVKSGEKITGETLPAVTQLFTEHYMVQFLLHNTIGAWHAGKVLTDEHRGSAESEQELRDAVCLRAIDRYDFEYLRFVREAKEGEDLNAGTGPWRPAAGTYDGWPKSAAELRVLDPCCGSGHFLVAAFELLVRLRIAEEDLSAEAAIRAVLADNLFGLELDPRCTQIAAFNLAFAAWKLAGKPIELPPLNIACSGIGPQSTKDEWLKMAKAELDQLPRDDRGPVERGLIHMHELFSDAPELGSLIDPSELPAEGFAADFETIKPLLDRILTAETADDEAHERAVAARGMAAAAEILAGDYTLVVTNVPYLGIRKQSDSLRDFCQSTYPEGRHDLANALMQRCWRFGVRGGSVGVVTPHNWLFASSFLAQRRLLLNRHELALVARLGEGAFDSPQAAGALVSLSVVSTIAPKPDFAVGFIDAANGATPSEKDVALQRATLGIATQVDVQNSRDSRILDLDPSTDVFLEDIAACLAGIQNGDSPRYQREFWELDEVENERWSLEQAAPDGMASYSGLSLVIDYDRQAGNLRAPRSWRREQLHDSDQRGKPVWGKPGIIASRMRSLPCALYLGHPYDQAAAAIVPHDQAHVPAVWSFCSSQEFSAAVREVDQKINVTSATLAKVPFDLDHWQTVAAEKYPDGLPEPQSDDPTQWLFHGRPERAEAHATLQVGVARLVGYRWPAELDEDMRLAPEARALVNRCAELVDHADDDGIVCLTPLRGEPAAADRLRDLLRDAFGDAWTSTTETRLLKAAGEEFDKGKACGSLEEWLRDKCFEHHCKLFHHRPFVWHIWDGRKDGFSALVNYHKLAGPDGQGNQTLRTLTYAYLRDWITRQEQEVKDGKEGADARLEAAQRLKDELEKILKGEPPYDLFVRWKPLHEQPIGWEPDINDGVRLNIRPFLNAEDVGKKGAGVLRWKPNVKWKKDRGKEPASLRPRADFPWFWTWDEQSEDFEGTPEFDGARWNDLHYTIAKKQAARERAVEEES
ncbi:MAG: hypothetical protein RLN78_10030 [Phycisphaerales bacterium]